MFIEPACMLCSIDPGTASLLVPVAQATIISAPLLFRDQIRRGVNVVRARRRARTNGEDPPIDATDGSLDVAPVSADQASD